MKTFAVSYSFGATRIVEAESKEAAIEQVENMDTEKLFDANCRKGFDVESAEEL